MAQLHKNFTDHQVKELICRYLGKETSKKLYPGDFRDKKKKVLLVGKGIPQ